MKEIYFLCEWGKNRERTWSGTCNGIFCALKSYFCVKDVPLRNSSVDFAGKIFRCVFLKFFRLNFYDFDMAKRKRWWKKFARKFRGKEIVALEFSEFLPLKKNFHPYFYVDLTVGALRKICDEEKSLFEFSGFQKIPRKKILEREKIQNEHLQNSAGIFVMGEWLKKDLVQCGFDEKKIHVVGAGINADKSKIDSSKKCGNKILFVGRDFERKNGPLVLKAFEIAQKIRPEIELYVAGCRRECKIQNVNFLGDVPYENLSDLFNRCDIFCMPSKFEAFGIAFVEALSFGLPCIVRDAFEMPYLVQDGKTGFVLKDENENSLADLMLKLLADEKIRQNVEKNRDFYIENFSWNSVAKKMADAIHHDFPERP
jgi:glycosyltransferase involved in cell wall biosynthesis